MEATSAGALRREKLTETACQKLEAELEQLKCLVCIYSRQTFTPTFINRYILIFSSLFCYIVVIGSPKRSRSSELYKDNKVTRGGD